MIDDTKQERRDVWSRFWATGALHSCATSYHDNYAGPIGEFWRSAFAMLAPGDAVLDIATGNGALPRLLLAERPETSIECDAVDLAQIAPAWLRDADPTQRQRVHVQGGVAAESLPFANDAFSLVVSQYGIEYADLSRAIPELLRVLSPGGRIRLVVHHAGSRPVQLASDEISHIDWLLDDEGLLRLAAAMVPAMARAATAAGRAALAIDPHANQTRSRFNSMQTAASARVANSACPDVLHEVREAVARIFGMAMAQGLDQAEQALSGMRAQLVDSRLRLDELRRHALDEKAVQSLCTQLAEDGGRVTRMPLSDAGHVMAWAICGDPES